MTTEQKSYLEDERRALLAYLALPLGSELKDIVERKLITVNRKLTTLVS